MTVKRCRASCNACILLRNIDTLPTPRWLLTCKKSYSNKGHACLEIHIPQACLHNVTQTYMVLFSKQSDVKQTKRPCVEVRAICQR